MNAPIIHPGDIEGPVRPSSSQAGVAAIRFSHPAPEIKVGDRRVWLSGHEIEVTRLVTSGQFAGEWEYRYVETGAPGIHSAIDLLSMTTPAPTDPSTGAVTQPNPAPVDAALPSLVELDRREAAAEAGSSHAVTIDYNTGAPFPTLTFHCSAPAGALCHAYYECSCEEWGQEGVVHGKPWHVDHDDVSHFGYWRNDECRLQDWFENSDEAVVGSVSVPVTPKYTGGWYEFDITAVAS